MLLTGIGGQCLEIRIAAYQFPDIEVADDDSNWLIVEGKVVHPGGEWTFRDPCLLTYEVSRLADWLESVAGGNPPSAELDFLEPNLHIRLVESPGGTRLRVYFELESRPDWAASNVAGEDDLWVELVPSEFELRQAAASLRRQLERHPPRAAR